MIITGFFLGFFGSLHCLGMCGPIAFLLPFDRTSKRQKILVPLYYHLGRIITYILIGLIFGLIGESLRIFPIQAYLSIFLGVSMLLFLFVKRKRKSFFLQRILNSLLIKLRTKLAKYISKKAYSSIFIIGLLNGFLPCGLVYIAGFSSLSINNLTGVLMYMFLFGLGTIPMMTFAIFSGGWFLKLAKRKVKSMIPFFIFVLGILLIMRGLELGIPYLSPANNISSSTPVICH